MIEKLLNSLDTPFTGERLFDHLESVVFFIKCDQGKYLVVNETFVSRCGLGSKDELIGKTPSHVFGTQLGSSYEKQDAKTLLSGESILSRLELHIYPDRSRGWCLTNKVPLKDRKGKPVGLVGVSQDLRLPRKESEIYRQISKAVRYAEENLSSAPSVNQLADLSGLSFYQFDRRMKIVFGLNSGQWLMQLRIEKAQHMLSQSRLSIAQVAFAIGYADQSAFSRQFRRATGLTPGQYRDVSS
ncbi:AraC family transcriptional regulator [bacterium]|nr:AraC family transcriptional regulator [bacterium]